MNWGRDLEPGTVADLRNAVEGDTSPGGGKLRIARGIEVGQIFQLGTKYSEAMNATVLDADGKPRHMPMGCYGIGVTRVITSYSIHYTKLYELCIGFHSLRFHGSDQLVPQLDA